MHPCFPSSESLTDKPKCLARFDPGLFSLRQELGQCELFPNDLFLNRFLSCGLDRFRLY